MRFTFCVCVGGWVGGVKLLIEELRKYFIGGKLISSIPFVQTSIIPVLTLQTNHITKIFIKHLFANHQQDLDLVRKYLFSHAWHHICLKELMASDKPITNKTFFSSFFHLD